MDARFGTKRGSSWTGYKSHLTETCDDDQPHLVINVETTPATPQMCVTTTIHQHLAEHQLLPREHLLDAGSVAAEALVDSQQTHQIDVIGPALRDHRWQARQPDGLDVSCFAIDWAAKQVTCPQGHTSVRWTPNHAQRGRPRDEIKVQFAASDCP